MKKTGLFIVLIIVLSANTPKKMTQKFTTFFVGTYTNGESKGIYQYQIDENGFLQKIGLKAVTNNPSFLAKTKDNKTLLAVNEVDENGTGFVNSYKIEKDSLVFVSKSKSGGAHPCFVTVNSKNQVLVANYTGGNVGYLQIDNQHGLTNLLAIQQHFGKGTTSRQEAPHAHSAWFHPKNNDIISVDLGTNQLWISTIDVLEKKFVFSNPKTVQMEAASGPRHLTFHPNKKWIYVLNELNNSISLVEKKRNSYKISSTVAMIPKDYKNYTKGADIHISKDGKFVYASNRGHNSIAIFSVNSIFGKLTLVGFESVKGENPRNFSLTPDNKFLVVANQDTNNIVSFQRDFKTGKLTFVSEIAAPNPVCVLF
jgi:6-phosphogluconolactonase